MGSVVIPDSVTYIFDSAFAGTSLTSVVIPDSVTYIGRWAFGTGLTSVVIPDSVTSLGDSAFAGTSLTSVVIPDSVTSIGAEAFALTGLTSVVIRVSEEAEADYPDFSSSFSDGVTATYQAVGSGVEVGPELDAVGATVLIEAQ